MCKIPQAPASADICREPPMRPVILLILYNRTKRRFLSDYCEKYNENDC